MSKKATLLHSAKIVLRMWAFAKPYKFRFFISFIVGCTRQLYYSLLFGMMTKLFMEVCISGDTAKLYSVLGYILLAMLGGMIVYPLCYGLIYTTYSKISGDVQKLLFTHAQKIPVSYVENRFSGDIISRVSNDFKAAIDLVCYPTVGQGNPFSNVFTTISIGVIVFTTNWILGFISLFLGLLGMFLTSKFAQPIKAAQIKVREFSGEATQSVINTLSGTMVARIFGLDDYLHKIYMKNINSIYKNNMSLIRKYSLMGAVGGLQGFLSFTGVTIIGLLMSVDNLIDIPTVIFIANLQMGMSYGLTSLGRAFAGLQGYIAGAERLFEFLDAPEEDPRKTAAKADFTADTAIQINNLCFKYQDTEYDIFKDFNLDIPKGQCLAVVGGSGGGKSTLFKLLLGFAEKQSGDIMIFGNNLESYSLQDLRTFFSYVPQDSYLFDGSIEENILWGNPGATKEQIWKAVKDAYLEDFIESLPEGINTRVGERGTQVSGGQKQRIAIARAFLKNAPIILLDEATSSLDSESEQEVQKALNKLMEGRTSIVIAHRLSTIKNADRIIVIEQGENIEEGSHSELLQIQGRYEQLYNMQFI